MKAFLTTLFILSAIGCVKAQENYDVSLIPKELLPYASSVVRNEEVTVEVKDFDNTLCHVKKAITVFNKNGDDDVDIAIWHDKSRSIRDIKGVIYNQWGKPAGKFSESDFDDDSNHDGFSLFTDLKIKHYQPKVAEYPYTISFEYDIRSKQSLDLDNWHPISSDGVAVEKSSYTLICKPDFKIKYKQTNLPINVVTGTNKQGQQTYTWQISNLKALKYEPYSPVYRAIMPSLKIVPEKFMYRGISGSFTNWKELGQWQYDKLNAGRQQLPPQTVAKMKELTASITDPKAKARKIYEYMQGKTHYISIQVGIGGLQPFFASDVDLQNYGDCKALVNYTQALLKAVDIESYYCVVQAGNSKVSLLPDFASLDQGNHVILCLPFKNDTTFVECTSQNIPFGFLGDFTDDRTVLACTPQGGKLMHTPKYTTQANLEQRKATFTLSENGGLSGTMVTNFKGADYEERDHVIYESKTEQIKDLKKIYPINNLEIESADLKQFKVEQPYTSETLKIAATDYGAITDGKIIFLANPANRITSPLREVRNRRNDVYINRGYTDEDEITYTLPTGYKVDMRPKKVSIEKPFGKFESSTTVNGDKLIYNRKLQIVDGTYSKDTYQALVDFYQSVADADNDNVTLIKGN
ncbi:DUF3857 domain-containing protein [Mucilaginibacter sp. SMC90]|uniref:DUF3857 domain-containing protein n=1 Tax=Mucilaginibacter sp. SMC90 TaxID=2929803 RepID=UPI001FB219F8|nr:DUF3857 domain-containing protein [Mucilaginibacter sp. SMC90]UOE46859.1 DUF3857 domain-containing protein [Mucilaginibacter sp. SMC90]